MSLVVRTGAMTMLRRAPDQDRLEWLEHAAWDLIRELETSLSAVHHIASEASALLIERRLEGGEGAMVSEAICSTCAGPIHWEEFVGAFIHDGDSPVGCRIQWRPEQGGEEGGER